MLKQLMASKAAQLIAACVCPVALTVAVPDVRKAVHNATAPRAYAKPKTRIRPPAPPVEQAESFAPPEDMAIAATDLAAPCAPQMTSLTGETLGDFASLPEELTDDGKGPALLPPMQRTGPALIGGAAVPEPATWVQMLVGFGAVGGATRHALRKPTARPAAVLS